ncbi:MAG: undecaprenyl-diphosphatase UppP [Spirochaetaceae bacterium]|nr:undecaprenyl-diphosphatase UppP [Spirochaetaceae bacterium]
MLLQAIVLGIIQGLAEFVPVSSSAHLVLVPWLLGWQQGAVSSLTFDVALHVGTLLAVLAYFAKDWIRLAGAWLRSLRTCSVQQDPDARMAWYILIACIPGGLSGVLLENTIASAFHAETLPLGSLVFMACSLAGLALLLLAAERLASHTRSLESMRAKDALLIGLAQAAAVIPGVSRSGSTITAGLALGLDRPSAARFSFLLSAPIIAGAGAKSILDLADQLKNGAMGSQDLMLFAVGMATAAVTGFLTIRYLLVYLQKRSTRIFAWYRIALALLILVVAFVRR